MFTRAVKSANERQVIQVLRQGRVALPLWLVHRVL